MAKTVIGLQEERAVLVNKIDRLLQAAERRGRDLTPTEKQQHEGLHAKVKELSAEIAGLERAEAARGIGSVSGGEYSTWNTNEFDPQAEDLRSFATGDGRKSIDVSLAGMRIGQNPATGQVEVRDLLAGSGSGANVVPTSFRRQLYEHMVASSAIRRAGPTVLVTDSGEDLSVPKSTANSTAGIVAEGATIPESDPTLGQVVLESFKYAFLIQLSGELLQDTGVDLVGFLARNAGRALGNASGAHFVTGTGTGQPRGALTASSVGVTGGAGTASSVTPDAIIDLWASVIPEYRERATWLMSSATWASVRKLKDSQGVYLVDSLGNAGDLRLLGRPAVIDPNMPNMGANAKSILFGDFSVYFIRDVGSIRIERSDDFAFANDLVTFRFIQRTDGDLVDETGALKHYANGSS